MGGGLMQLVAYGAQDIYLTGNPQITFFKVVYRRHTNFSMESIQQTMSGTVATSGRSTCTVSRNGDLVHRMYLQQTIDPDNGVNSPNHSAQIIDSVELEIGGQRIDRHYGKWMEAWAELTENKTGRAFGTLFQSMSGMGEGTPNDAAATVNAANPANNATTVFFFNNQGGANTNRPDTDREVYVPLQFWFCRNPGLALPLIALQYHEVKVIFNWGADLLGSSGHELWVDYIYLDTDERRRFAQVSHEYLIEQVQHQSIAGGAQSIDLNFNHPVKELVIHGEWASGVLNAATDATLTDIADTMTLKLNGHERFSPRPISYFSRAQVLQHHTAEGGFVDGSILVYSFALKPEEHQPSGTCNFSRIDNAQLNLNSCSFNANSSDVYAVNYNVLRIMSGMGGLAYSN